MTKTDFTPEQHRTEQAERANRFLTAISAVAVILLFVGDVFAASYIDLVTWLCLTVWVVVVAVLIAFIRGATGGSNHG